MPWYFPWSDSIKKRACRYVLQHYLGQFLQEQLTLDQLTVDLFKGEGILKDVALDVLVCNYRVTHSLSNIISYLLLNDETKNVGKWLSGYVYGYDK